MHFKLVCPSSPEAVISRPENAGCDREAVARSLEVRSADIDTYEVVDTSDMPDSDRWSIYSSQAIPAAGNRYRIRRVFASNRHPGEDFGRGTPALLVYM